MLNGANPSRDGQYVTMDVTKMGDTGHTTGRAVDVQEIMVGIRRRVRAQDQRDKEAVLNARKSIPNELIARASRLNARIGAIRANTARIGEIPPAPASFRGSVGAVAVRLVRRALFWFIPSLQGVHEQLALALEDQTKINEELVKAIEQTNVRIMLLQSERAAAQKSGG